MKNDRRIDDLFRKGLAEVDLPPAPGLDWTAMANSAKEGARAASAGERRSAVAGRWIKLLGGASAILVAWYLAAGPSLRNEERGDPSHASDMVPTNAKLLGGAPGTLLDLLQDAGSGATMDGSSSTAISTTQSDPGPRASNALVQAGRTAVASSAIAENGGPRVKHPRMWSSVFSAAGVGPDERTGPEGHGYQATSGDGPAEAPMEAALVSEGSAGPIQNAGDQAPTARLPFLCMLPSTLDHRPVGVPMNEVDYGRNTRRWTIAPWIALGRSVWSDPEKGDRKAFTGVDERSLLGRTIGLRVHFAFAEQLAIVGGLQFAQKGALRGAIRSSSTLTTAYDLSGEYLEIPLSLEFNKPWGRRAVYARSGILLRFNMRSGSDQVVMTDTQAKERSTLVLADGSMGTALDIGLGMRFPLAERISLAIEPAYQFGLSSVVRHPSFDRLPFNPRIHTFSLATGISLQLD